MADDNERGQALPALLVVMGVVAVAIVVLIQLAATTHEAARARTAADAAALAGAAAGRPSAGQVAEANGGELLEYRAIGSVVEVGVRVGDATARARAEREVTWVPAGRVDADRGRERTSVVPQ